MLIHPIRSAAARPGSIELDPRELDHLAPFLVFIGDELAIVAGAHRRRYVAKVDEAASDPGIGDTGIDRLVERADDFGRRTARRPNAQASHNLVARHGLADGRYIGQRSDALWRRHRKRPELASFDVPQAGDN